MAKPRGPIKGVEKYTLRHYDAYDHYWFDVKANIGYQEAKALWLEETKNGTRYTQYSDGAYFDIFPADTRMIFNEPIERSPDIN